VKNIFSTSNGQFWGFFSLAALQLTETSKEAMPLRHGFASSMRGKSLTCRRQPISMIAGL
jgi:hypothetical protein